MKKFFKWFIKPESSVYRLYALIALLIFLGVSVRNIMEYRSIIKEIDHTAYSEAELLHEYFLSINEVYNTQYLNSGVEINDKTIGFLPSHAAPQISDIFVNKTSHKIILRNVSDQVRNIKNTPTRYEREAITYFKQNPQKKILTRNLNHDGKNFFFYAAPIKIEAQCLLCHGKREDAPPYIRYRYDSGYDYKLGDVRGILSIIMDKGSFQEDAQQQYKDRFIYSVVIAAAVVALIFLIVWRTKRTEKDLLEKLKKMSFSDPLTSLYNRRKMIEYMTESHYILERYKEPYSLIMIDIDHFKLINDQYGHDIGDAVLKKISSVLQKNVRHTDHVARWGGEEFLILCPKTNWENAARLAEDLRQLIEASPVEMVERCTASFGVAQASENDSVEILIKRADEALYKAKASGRNRVCVSDLNAIR